MGDLGAERYRHRVVARHFGLQQCGFRFHHAAKTAPEIDFPGKTKIKVVEGEVVFEQRHIVGTVLADIDVRRGSAQLLDLRKLLAGRNAELCIGLQHTKTRAAQRQVLRLRGFDKAVQYRVVEYRPPFNIVCWLAVDAILLSLEPLIRDLQFRRLVVGAKVDAGGQQHDRQHARNPD